MKRKDLLHGRLPEPENESRILLDIYRSCLVFILLAAAVLLRFYDRLFADYTTALYWIGELILLADGLTKAFVFPVLIFEILCLYFGLKKNGED